MNFKYINKIKNIPIKLASKNIIKMSDEEYLKKLYKINIGKDLDLDNPKGFNEKIQWLKLHDRKDIYTKLVDKYEVRNYLKERVGEEFVIPLLGVWNNVKEIDFDSLPNKFVLKCTHDSGGVVICKDKKTFNIKKAKRKLEKSLKSNFYYVGREWPYKNVKPRIICEQYLEDSTGKNLMDYKIMCFNGKAKCSFVCSNRGTKNGLNIDFYDLEWNHLPLERHYKNSPIKIEKPKMYDKMIEISEKIAKDFTFIRVDFYEINNKLYIGELTFYPGSGFEEFKPEEYDQKFGEWIKL